jgi:CDP-4-dehydro-6-deoxyglucose reductase, E1
VINLINDNINNHDIDQLIDWLKTYPRLTKGPLTEQFEQEWADFIGTKYAVFVNSGSSANLIALAALIESGRLKRGDKVAVPAVSWATDLAPVVQLGLEPVLIDCNFEDLSIKVTDFTVQTMNNNIKALMYVEILGLPPNLIDVVMGICKENNIIVIEDACESLGAKSQGRNLGTFGLMSTFSTYFGHHISTIEGGMVCTDDKDIYNVLKSLRSHGWGRDLDEDVHAKLKADNNVTEFKDLFTFYYNGFNLRATDLQAFLGINQLKKLPQIIEDRKKNYKLYYKYLDDSFWKPDIEVADSSCFAYPIISMRRDEIVKALNDNDVGNRPLVAGSLANQPFYQNNYPEELLPRADIVDKNGFYVPAHSDVTEDEIKFICDIINQFTDE